MAVSCSCFVFTNISTDYALRLMPIFFDLVNYLNSYFRWVVLYACSKSVHTCQDWLLQNVLWMSNSDLLV